MSFIGCIGLNKSDDDDFSVMRFFIPYIFGFAMALGGTLFFNGIMGQVKKAFGKDRRIQTITIIGTLLLIIIIGFTAKNAWICMILMLSQFSAIFAYAGTMIPGCKKYLCCCCRLFSKGATAGAAAVV